MKSLLLATAVLAFGAGTAAAQDQVYNWSGAYVGAQAGYGWGDARAVNGGGGYIPFDPDGLIGGVYAGYNYRFAEHLIIGVDADFTGSDAKGSSIAYLHGGVPLPINYGSAEVNWSAAIRTRIGYSADRFMPYIAGGIAFADMDHSIMLTDYSGTYTGWTIGGGLEYALNDNLVLRGEYRYSDFGEHDFPLTNGVVPHSVDLKTQDLRFGIAYKF